MANSEHDTVYTRPLRSDEVGFLQEMLYAALAWRPDATLPPVEWVLAHPQVSIFHEGWGRHGDVALVAEVDDRPVGLVWYRYFTEEAHGEGFVDEVTPELAIAVVDGYRGRGIGRLLMNAAHEQGADRRNLTDLAERRSREPGKTTLRVARIRRVRVRRRARQDVPWSRRLIAAPVTHSNQFRRMR